MTMVRPRGHYREEKMSDLVIVVEDKTRRLIGEGVGRDGEGIVRNDKKRYTE
jgi:hypothetical protein